jgi:CxxC-x17-CxxC domain-containing protein
MMKYPHDHDNDIIFFARTNFRNRLRKFGIRTDDRRRHMYVIGKSGVGKTTMLENMMLADLYYGHGIGVMDPHGDSAEKLINSIPEHRINDVVYFNPSDTEHCIGFNVLESVKESQRHLIASGLMGVFKKIWPDVWSARMEHIMSNTVLSLLENPGSTLMGINRVLVDRDFRRKIVAGVKDPVVKAFWITEFEQWDDKYRTEAIAPIQNKVGQFLSTSIIRNILAQEKSTINIRDIMDGNKVLIVNLSKGRIGEDASRLMGGLLVTKMQLSAMERVDVPENDRQDFYLYIDEFQNFATESFANILSEARKYRLCLTMAHQYIEQLDEKVCAGVFGNAGTIISFRVGAADAPTLAVEFAPKFIEDDLVNLPMANIYLKLLCNGISSDPFSATTLPPIRVPVNNFDKVVDASRKQWTVPRGIVEERILKWSETKPVIDEKMIVEMPKEKPKKLAPWMHEYTCTRCNKTMQLPVELDKSRPIYCEDCIDIVRAERKGGKKPEVKKPMDIKSSQVVEKRAAGEISLSALGGVPVPSAPTVSEKVLSEVKNNSVTQVAPQAVVNDEPRRKRRRRRRNRTGVANANLNAGTNVNSNANKQNENFQVVSSKDDIFPW